MLHQSSFHLISFYSSAMEQPIGQLVSSGGLRYIWFYPRVRRLLVQSDIHPISLLSLMRIVLLPAHQRLFEEDLYN
jgi:hypothetical protein